MGGTKIEQPSTCRNMELKELKEKTQTKEGDEEIVLMCTCFAFRINLKFSKYKQYFIICTFHIHFTRLFFFPKVQNENELNPVSSQRIIFTKNEGEKTSTCKQTSAFL